MIDSARPGPFSAYTTPEFWDDEHISAQMLAAHLDPSIDAASRRHDFIDRAVDWLVTSLELTAGSRVLDLGCGPGLYACRIARRGAWVRGIDVSRRSIAYAIERAVTEGLTADFQVADYLNDDLFGPYDVALLSYEDFCALSPRQRSTLLVKINAALAPSGALVMDVTSQARFGTEQDAVLREPQLMNGFWASAPYEGVQETFTYPELRLVLDRFTIITAEETKQYWNWMQCLTPEEVAAELDRAGFEQPDVFGDLAGAPYDPTSVTFAVVARRPGS